MRPADREGAESTPRLVGVKPNAPRLSPSHAIRVSEPRSRRSGRISCPGPRPARGPAVHAADAGPPRPPRPDLPPSAHSPNGPRGRSRLANGCAGHPGPLESPGAGGPHGPVPHRRRPCLRLRLATGTAPQTKRARSSRGRPGSRTKIPGTNLLSRFLQYHRPWRLNGRVRNGIGCDPPGMGTGEKKRNRGSQARSENDHEAWMRTVSRPRITHGFSCPRLAEANAAERENVVKPVGQLVPVR